MHKAEQAFYQVGDCSFDSNGHHGTPNQRLKASIWGAELAAQAASPFPVLASDTLFDRFEKKLPEPGQAGREEPPGRVRWMSQRPAAVGATASRGGPPARPAGTGCARRARPAAP